MNSDKHGGTSSTKCQTSIFVNNSTVAIRGRGCDCLQQWSPVDCSLVGGVHIMLLKTVFVGRQIFKRIVFFWKRLSLISSTLLSSLLPYRRHTNAQALVSNYCEDFQMLWGTYGWLPRHAKVLILPFPLKPLTLSQPVKQCKPRTASHISWESTFFSPLRLWVPLIISIVRPKLKLWHSPSPMTKTSVSRLRMLTWEQLRPAWYLHRFWKMCSFYTPLFYGKYIK